jgi:hypothetical protein
MVNEIFENLLSRGNKLTEKDISNVRTKRFRDAFIVVPYPLSLQPLSFQQT